MDRMCRVTCCRSQPATPSSLAGHANTNEELVAAARAQIASLAASEKTSG
jgi:hypothetical protein